jgi:hypothetical protein
MASLLLSHFRENMGINQVFLEKIRGDEKFKCIPQQAS